MPGFTTHYLFGTEVLKHLNASKLKKTIQENRKVYNLGLQGPDIFFFKLTTHLHKGHRNPGVYLHEKQINGFFTSCFETIKDMPVGREKERCIAYACGFVCHYILDSVCHPYIYWKTNSLIKKKRSNTFGIHSEIETSIDAGLLKRCRGLRPLDFHTGGTIALSASELKTVSAFLSSVINRTYARVNEADGFQVSPSYVRRAVTGLQKGCVLLRDRNGIKKKAVRSVECFLFRFTILSGLFVTNHPKNPKRFFNEEHRVWTNPWDNKNVSTASVPELFNRALSLSIEALCTLGTSPKAATIDRLLQSMARYTYHGMAC